MLSKLKRAFMRELGIGTATADDLLKKAKIYDKAYELSCLIETMKQLKSYVPGSSFALVGGTSVTFRAKGGPIDRRQWPYITMSFDGVVKAELRVDIECAALSAWRQHSIISYPTYGLAHELDIVLVQPGTSGHPTRTDYSSESKPSIESSTRRY